MDYISKLYFNTIERIGNLRLLFVFSCLFALISLIDVGTKAIDYVQIINLKSVSLEEVLSAYNPNLQEFKYGTQYHDFVEAYKRNHPRDSILAIADSVVARKYCVDGLYKDAFYFGQTHFSNIGPGKKYYEPKQMCLRKSGRYIYTVKYLWNFLWVIFWFYFPFLLVCPVKFIIDGYKQDKE